MLMKDDESLLWSRRTAAKALGISERNLDARTEPRGDIPCIRVGKRVLYSPAALKRWIQRKGEKDGGKRAVTKIETDIARSLQN